MNNKTGVKTIIQWSLNNNYYSCNILQYDTQTDIINLKKIIFI